MSVMGQHEWLKDGGAKTPRTTTRNNRLGARRRVGDSRGKEEAESLTGLEAGE
jgi:hypothetical protein